MWSRDWLFRQWPVKDLSKRTSIHCPTGLLGRCFIFGAFLSIQSSVSVAQDPATVGQFSARTTWPYKAVHAAVLPTGKVIWWPSFANGDNPYLWDPSTNTFTALAHVGANIFCAGHAFLPSGQLFVAGGHISSFVGLPNTYTYDPATGNWNRLPNMNAGRWYPTSTTLPSGDICCGRFTRRASTPVTISCALSRRGKGRWCRRRSSSTTKRSSSSCGT